MSRSPCTRGEIHCLLGENGAGKSTLMGILAGMQQPDSRQIRVDGEQVADRLAATALDLGIGTVYQHSTLVAALTVVENLMLGDSSRAAPRTSPAHRRVSQEFARLLGVDIDPDASSP